MYRECCEGKLDESWFITEKKRLNFEQFRMLLSEQMLKYEPQQNEYPGDDKFRSSTRQHKSRRSSSNDKENGDLEFRNSGDQVSSLGCATVLTKSPITQRMLYGRRMGKRARFVGGIPFGDATFVESTCVRLHNENGMD